MRCARNQNDFCPTPLYGGVKGKLIDKNSNGSTLLLVTRVSTSLVCFSIGLVLSSTCSTMVTSIGTT
jgi:hypothetical protein